MEFDDYDIDNVVTNLRRPQYIFHAEVPAHAGSAEVPASIGVVEVLHVPAVLAHA